MLFLFVLFFATIVLALFINNSSRKKFNKALDADMNKYTKKLREKYRSRR